MANEKDTQNKVQYLPIFMCLGLSVGMAIGAAIGNTSIGMCMGIAAGVGIGALIDAKHRNDGNEES